MSYAGSKLATGASNIVPAITYLADRVNKGLTGQSLLDDDEKADLLTATEETARMGLNKEYQGSDKTMTAVGGLLEFIPAALAAESTGGASFYLNGIGNAYKEVQQLKKDGAKFENGAEDLYIQGKGIADYFLMTKLNAHSLFPTLPSALRNVASREASMTAIKDLVKAGKPLTSEGITQAFKDSAINMADQIKTKGVPFLKELSKGYAKTSADLIGLSAADAGLKKLSNVVAGEDNFKQENGELGQNIAQILTSDAPLFAAVGARNNLGLLFDKSPVRNEVVEALKNDASPENIERIKQSVQQEGANREWSADDLEGTLKHIDVLAGAVQKIPKTLSEGKYSEALDIVLGKQNLTEQLSKVQEQNKTLDPALAEVGTPEERALTAKLEQSDDKLREVVTGKKTKYFEETKEGGETEYFKQLGGDGKPEKITKERFELEQVEKEAKDIGKEQAEEAAQEAVTPEVVETPFQEKEVVVEPEIKPEAIEEVKPKIEPNEEVKPIVSEKENVVKNPVSAERTAEVLKKAEDDLEGLKQTTKKQLKHEASLKRLTEAKNKGEISEKEFNDLKNRFDDVLAENSGNAEVKDETPPQVLEDHKKDIHEKFRKEFKNEGNTDEQINAALALMEARAKSWAKQTGKNADEWYQQIADVKSGQFESDDVLYQFIPKKLKTTAKFATMMAMIWNINAKIPNKIFQHRDDAKTVKFLKELSDKGFIYIDKEGKTDKYNSESFKGNESFTYLQKLWAKSGYPKINIEVGGRSKYNPALNELDIRVSAVEDGVASETGKDGKTEYILDQTIILAEMSHALQASKGELSVGRFLKDLVSSKMNYEKQYGEKGTIENDAHENIQKELEEGFSKSIKYQEESGVKKGALETLQDGKVVIHALESPDFSTMVHEIAHIFEKDLNKIEAKVVKDFGGSEAFARGFERYLREGKAPTEQLKGLFDQFKTWLTDIYKTLKGSPIEKKLTPEIKQLFDKLLTEEGNDTTSRKEPTTSAEATKEVVQQPQDDTRGSGSEDSGSSKEQSGEPKSSVSDKFTELAHRSVQTEEVRNTLNNIERETGRELSSQEKEYQRTSRMEAVQHGNNVVEEAKAEFGDDYATKLIEYLQEAKTMSIENKSLITISLENDLERRILAEPENEVQLNKQLKLVRDISTKQQRSAAIAVGYGVLRQLARVGYDINQVTEKFFSSEQNESKRKINKAVEATAEDIQKEYEAKEETVSPDLEEAISKGVEKAVNDIYEKLPSKRRESADKAIAALDRIQKKLRSKAYSDPTMIVATIDAGITTIKAAIKAGVTVADAIELGIKKIKELHGKKWAKEDDFRKDMLSGFAEENIDVKEGTRTAKVKTDAEKLADAKKRVKERIEELQQQIIDKKKELKATKRVSDPELTALQALEANLKKEAMKYLSNEAKSLVDERMKATAVKKLQNEIEKLNQQIAKGEKDEMEAKRNPINSPEIEALKAEKKAKLETLEIIDPTPKDFIRNALIEKGFSRTIKVNGVERETLDWKKLAGEEGSIDKMRGHVEEVLKEKGYSEGEITKIQESFEQEYNDLRASVIEKGLNELANRNKEKPKADVKSTAKRLAELYNYGLFESQHDTYDYLMNNALGLSGIGQEAFFEGKVLAKSLAELYASKADGRTINEFGLNSAVNQINHQIEQLLAKIAWNESNGAYKAARVAQEYLSMSQRAILTTLKQLGDNSLSGYIERTFNKLTFAFEKNDAKALKQQRSALGRTMLKDATYNAGLDYGDISNPFLIKSATENYINNVSTSSTYHAFVSAVMGRIYLEGMDGMHKAVLTEKYFTRNLVKVLTDKNNPKRMPQEEAVQYVAENLTGQKFSDAVKTAHEIVEKVNRLAGKKVLPENKEFEHRLAMDIVKESLVTGDKVTLDQIEASYGAGYTVAGLGMGHEANNFASRTVGLLNSYNEGKLKDAIKEKRWNEAAMLTFTSILSKNILNPFVGGASNWVTLTLQKAGVDAWSPLENFVKRRKLDLTTEKGIKDMEYALMSEAKAKSTAGRVFIGAAVSLLTASIAISTGKDKDLAEWRAKNKWAEKYFGVVSPPSLLFLLALKDKKMGKFLQGILNQKVPAFDDGTKVVKGITSATEGDLKKAGAYAGDVLGSKTSLPIVPYRFGRQVQNVYRGLTGQGQITPDYSQKSFLNSFYRDGFVNYLGLTPEGEPDKPLTKEELKDKIEQAKAKVNETIKAMKEK